MRYIYVCLYIHVQWSNTCWGYLVHQASPIKMVATDDFNDAADKAVKIANIVSSAEDAGLEVQFSMA